MKTSYEEYLEVKAYLDACIDIYHSNMVKRDQAEYEYREAKTKKIRELLAEGMAKTLILDTVKGDENVNLLCLKRDNAITNVEANKEAINIKKIEANVLKDMMAREWSNSNG